MLQSTEKMKELKKDNPFVCRKYRVREGQVLQVREGYIGNLKTGDATGPLQWEFLERWGEKFDQTTIELLNEITLQ